MKLTCFVAITLAAMLAWINQVASQEQFQRRPRARQGPEKAQSQPDAAMKHGPRLPAS